MGRRALGRLADGAGDRALGRPGVGRARLARSRALGTAGAVRPAAGVGGTAGRPDRPPRGPGYGAPHGGAVAAFPLASWGQRAVAKIIDIVLESLLALPFALWLLGPAVANYLEALPADGSLPSQDAMAGLPDRGAGLTLTLSLISTAITFLYEVPQNVRWGRTAGHAGARHPHPAAVRGRAAHLGQATVRWAAYAVGVLRRGRLLVPHRLPLAAVGQALAPGAARQGGQDRRRARIR